MFLLWIKDECVNADEEKSENQVYRWDDEENYKH
jgi:hypothetical protein